VKGM